MNAQKIKISIITLSILLCSGIVVNNVLAAASATVSWVPPTTDEGGGALTGLAGYKVFYNTTSTWLNHLTACTGLGGTTVDVPGGTTTSYRFNNNLTPGQTYFFAVAAYDNETEPNISKCATGGGLTEVSKRVSYVGDINNDWVVNGGDVTTLAGVYYTNNSASDVNKDGTVNGGDVTLLAEDYLKPAL
jgi:hypothetical protein